VQLLQVPIAIRNYQYRFWKHSFTHRAPRCPEMSQMSLKLSWNQQLSWNFTHLVRMDLNLQINICCHQVTSFKPKMHQIRFRLGLRPRPRWGSLQRSPRPPLDRFELSNVNWTCLYMLIKVPVCFSSYNNNIYGDRKTCIFCVLSLMKPTKMSWNFLKIGSWNFTSCSWEPCTHMSWYISCWYSACLHTLGKLML